MNQQRLRSASLPGGSNAMMWLEVKGDKVEVHHKQAIGTGTGSGSGGGWPRCNVPGCLGEAVAPGLPCLAHASDGDRSTFLGRTVPSKRRLDVRGTVINQRLFDEIVASAAFIDGAAAVPVSLSFCEISARVRFERKTLNEDIDFSGAAIYTSIEFYDCVIGGRVNLRHASFEGGPFHFTRSTIKRGLDCSFATQKNNGLGLSECSVEAGVVATGMTAGLQVVRCRVSGGMSLESADMPHLLLTSSSIGGVINLRGSKISSIQANETIFSDARSFGLTECRYLSFDNAVFNQRIQVDIAGQSLSMSGARFDEGGTLNLSGDSLSLEGVRLGASLRVVGTGRPLLRVLSVVGADAGKMSFAEVDMSRCRFYGAHGLSSIGIEPSVHFERSLFWRGGRRFIADEFAWRSRAPAPQRLGWHLAGVAVDPPELRPGVERLIPLQRRTAAQVAATYRDLRCSLEARSDMAGASDFYYGEMVMRLHSGGISVGERALLWMYWAVSGFGLRPLRALATWITITLVGAAAMQSVGFETTGRTFSEALVFAVRAAVPAVTVLEKSLTELGHVIEVVLRVLGTSTLALLVLSIRTRLMRKPGE